MHYTLLENLAVYGAKYLFILIIGTAFIFFLRQTRAKQKEMVAFGIIALPIMYGVLKLVALLYFDPRPFAVEHFTPLIPHEPDNGFPSDHTILSAATASVITPYSKKISGILWILTLLVGLSRIYTGLHHAVDIAGSIVIAGVIALIVYKFVLPSVIRSGWYNKLFRTM